MLGAIFGLLVCSVWLTVPLLWNIRNSNKEIITYIESIIIILNREKKLIRASDGKEMKPGANRKERTPEQKKLASEMRKEWWVKKKESKKIPDSVALHKEFIPPSQQARSDS